jgi:formate C-acetyltransferase
MTDRLVEYRRQSLERGFAPHESPKEANWTHAFFEFFADRPLWERQARSLAHALENEPHHVWPLERIAGQIYQGCPGSGAVDLQGGAGDPRWSEFAAAPVAARWTRERLPGYDEHVPIVGDGAAPGHVGWDHSLILSLGTTGLAARYREALGDAPDEKAAEFYQAVLIVLEGVEGWVARLVERLREEAAQAEDEARRDELLERAAICDRVPAGPATTFREAVQSFWLEYLAVMYENPYGGNGPGMLDRYLWPYLKADLDRGAITLDEARELLVELFLKLHERIAPHDGWVEAIVVGGRAADGSLAITPLSHLMIEAYMELNQSHPSLYVRLPDDAPEEFLDLTARYLREGGNRAQVYADDAMIRALHADGVALEDAREWMAGGCMEVSPQAKNSDFEFAFAHNVALSLELVLNGGRKFAGEGPLIAHHETLTDYRSFGKLYAAFEAELARELSLLFRRLDICCEAWAQYRPAFLLSSLTHDCLERGRTVNDGGVRYPDYGGSGVGLPNVADSLLAIRRALYDEGFCPAEELLSALRADFEGYEALRARLLGLPKFGQDDPDADAMADRVLRSFTDLLHGHRTLHGGHVRPVILGFVWVVTMGQEVGATADGRRAGQPLAHGLSPQSGAMSEGITAAINSATRLSLDQVGGGSGMMWDLDPAWATQEVVKGLLRTFAHKGGQIFQGNILDTETLLRAQENPDRYRDLLVRVGGFSARWVTLSREHQDEIIRRRRFNG